MGIHQEPAPPYLLKVLVVKGDLGRPRLPHARAIVRGFFIRWGRDGGEPAQRVQGVQGAGFVWGGGSFLPEMAWTATRRKPFTSPFSLTMATRCTRGTG